MIGILDRDPDGYSPYIIICLIQPRSRSRCEKWGIFKSRLIASKSLHRLDIPYALHVHVADFQGNFRNGEAVRVRPMPYTMSGAVHSNWNSPQRSDAVHSDVKFASASFIVMLLMHNLKKIMMLPRPSSGTSGRSARRWWIRRGVVHRERKLFIIEGCDWEIDQSENTNKQCTWVLCVMHSSLQCVRPMPYTMSGAVHSN